MELIDRYLQAVKFALPQAQRDDIVNELRDSILSQIEEKEATLGRPLNEAEQVELLKKLGSPTHLASSYGKQQYLIGGNMFPIYWKVLKWALGLAFLVHAASSIAMAAAGKPFIESLGVLFRYPSAALTVFAWVTLIFAAMGFFGAKFGTDDHWDPRKLPPLVKQSPRKSRFELIAQLVIQTIFGVWWLAGLHYQYLIFGPGVAFFRFGPIWQTIYPLFVVTVVVDLSFTAAMYVRPQWTQGRNVTRVVMSALGLVVLYFLITAPELFVAAEANAAEFQPVAKIINSGVHLGLIIAAIMNIVNVVRGLARLIWQKLGGAHPAAAGM
jgi:hypothetical protein